MYIDTHDTNFRQSSIDCDIAIIGAGPAGITLAQQFKDTSIQVCVLESGGFASDAQVQQLSTGEAETPSPAFEKDYLSLHSQRLFGGTGSIWGGYCRPLDSIDFEQRDLPFSHHWPITREDLAPFYPWHALEGKYDESAVGGSKLHTKYYEHVTYPFNVLHRDEFSADKNIRVLLNATVTDLVLRAGNTLAHANVVNRRQQSLQVNAKIFVLACGGAGNVKILLNANGVEKYGIGNAHDQVGRSFMEHPHFQFFNPPALLWLADKQAAWLFRSDRYKPAFYLDADLVKQEKLLNFCAMLSPPFEKDSQFAGSKQYQPNFAPLSPKTGAFCSLAFRCEQSPNAASRITLDATRDSLGQRRVRLHWDLTEVDSNSLLRSIHLLAEELGRGSLGRLRIMLNESRPWQTAVGGGHLMGTTRMSESPTEGVVDRNCKVHDKDNLYIAGSSVFATSGVSNPTLTVMALARRLGQHLQEKLHDA